MHKAIVTFSMVFMMTFGVISFDPMAVLSDESIVNVGPDTAEARRSGSSSSFGRSSSSSSRSRSYSSPSRRSTQPPLKQ